MPPEPANSSKTCKSSENKSWHHYHDPSFYFLAAYIAALQNRSNPSFSVETYTWCHGHIVHQMDPWKGDLGSRLGTWDMEMAYNTSCWKIPMVTHLHIRSIMTTNSIGTNSLCHKVTSHMALQGQVIVPLHSSSRTDVAQPLLQEHPTYNADQTSNLDVANKTSMITS